MGRRQRGGSLRCLRGCWCAEEKLPEKTQEQLQRWSRQSGKREGSPEEDQSRCGRRRKRGAIAAAAGSGLSLHSAEEEPPGRKLSENQTTLHEN